MEEKIEKAIKKLKKLRFLNKYRVIDECKNYILFFTFLLLI